MYKNERAFVVYNECKIFIYKFTTYVPRTFRMDKNHITYKFEIFEILELILYN